MKSNGLKKEMKNTWKTKIGKKNLLFGVMTAILLTAVAVFYFCLYSPPYKLEYAIQSLTQMDNTLSVNLKISNIRNRDKLELYKGKVDSYDYTFRSLKGKSKTTFKEDSQYIEINNIDSDYIIFGYKVKIGGLDKHGHSGEINTDLLTFEGQKVLLMPLEAYDPSQNTNKKNISEVNVIVKSNKGWTRIVPFESKGSHDENTSVSVVDSPTWLDFYQLSKSCFALGKFNREQLTYKYGVADLYFDPSMNNLSEDTKKGLASIFDYYGNLFGKGMPQFSLVLLNKSSDDSKHILGGSSTLTLGSTFDPDNKRDWELMSHRLYHAFFDTNVKSPMIFSAPNLWFYEGLATYYENTAIGFLPDSIKNRLSIDSNENFNSLFRKYVYMYYKDPKIKEIIPANEEQYVNSGGKTEFLHYTLAPLIIKAIEDKSLKKYNQQDRTIKFILKEYKDKPFDIKNIVQYSIGKEDNSFYNSHILKNDILPLWKSTGKGEKSSKIITELNDIEYYLYTWFRNEIKDYPLNVLEEEKLADSLNNAKKHDIHFADTKTESLIMDLSPTVYGFLMQNELSKKNYK